MKDEEIKEVLSQQLQLLAKHSEQTVTDHDLAEISSVMIGIARLLLLPNRELRIDV